MNTFVTWIVAASMLLFGGGSASVSNPQPAAVAVTVPASTTVVNTPTPVSAPAAASTQTQSVTPVPQTAPTVTPKPATVVHNTVTYIPSGLSNYVSNSTFNLAIANLRSDLLSHITSAAPVTPIAQISQQVAANGFYASYNVTPISAPVNNLSNTTISNPTITGGSISSSSLVGTVTNAINSAVGAIDALTSTSVTATSATTSMLAVTATSTLNGVTLSNTNCSSYGNGGKLTTDAFGNVVCATDQGGAGTTVAGANTQIQFNNAGSFGASANLTFNGSYLTTPGFLSLASSTVVGNFFTTGVGTFGSLNTGSSTLGAATTTSLAITNIPNTLLSTNANGSVVATSSIGTNLLSGTLLITNGGTGINTAPTLGQLLVGNGSGGYTLTATSSLGINSGNWGNITGTLASQTDLQNALNAKLSLSNWYATTTDALAQGTTNKYFSNALAQGAISVTGAPFTYSGGVIGMNQATGSQNGYLTSADWTTFNNKISLTSLSAGTGIGYNSSTGAISNTGVTSLTATYPLLASAAAGSVNLSLGFGTTTANTWSSLQTFANGLISNASSTFAAVLNANTLNLTNALGIASGGTGTSTQVTNGVNYFNGSRITSGTALTFDGTTLTAPSLSAINATVSGALTLSGGIINQTTNSTTTINNNKSYAWTMATSSTANPLIQVDTTSGGESVSIGQAVSSGSSVVFGATGQPANLVFAASSTIQGADSGQLLTFGANSDVINFGVNVGIGSSTPGSLLSLGGIANFTAATSTFYSAGGINLTGGCFSVNGTCISGAGGGGGSGTNYFTLSGNNLYNNAGTNIGINNSNPLFALDVGGFINTTSTNGGFKIDGLTALYASSTNLVTFGGQGAGANIITSATSSSVTSSTFATAFGYQALGNATSSGYKSTAIGYQALLGSSAISSAGINTAIGYLALTNNTSGSSNTAIGGNALRANSTGSNNAAVGVGALTNNLTGNNNNAFGTNALGGNLTGGGNMAIGFNSLLSSVTGTNNVGIGYQSLMMNVSATSSVAIGYNTANGNALTYNNQGGTYIGYQAGFAAATGSDYNTFLGYQAGYNATSGSNNIWIGAASTTANANLTTGSQNILIGNNISLPSATASGQLNIANILFGTGNTGTGTNISTGSIGIGTSSPQQMLHLWGSNADLRIQNSASSSSFSDIIDASQTQLQINKSAQGAPTIDINPMATDGASAGQIRFFRNTNTTGGTYFQIFKGNNSTSVNDQLSGNSNNFFNAVSGNTGIGTSTAWGKFAISANSGDVNANVFVISSSTAVFATTTLFKISNTGALQFGGYGAGTLSTDASGNVTVSSDERLKNIDHPFARGLTDLDKLSPILYHWNATSGLDQTTQYAGFSAQNVQSAIPEAVGQDSRGYLTLQDRPILATVVNAVKEIAGVTDSFRTNLVAWLADASNGIGDLYAHVGHFGETDTQKLCVGQTCVTETELKALLASANVASVGSTNAAVSTSATATSASAPVIAIAGNNPAFITVGTDYNDLGAVITGPAADTNLNILTYLNGVLVPQVTINTSAVATDTIDYVVTDPAGLTSTSTRTVIIQAGNANGALLMVPTPVATTTDPQI